MLLFRWLFRLVRDVIMSGIVNRSPFMSISILLFLVLGLVLAAVQVTAPFIYTLF